MEATKREKRRGKRETRRKIDDGEDKASPELPSLPLDLMTEILLRTPVRSVGRFRCVSKTFYSVLTNRKFAKNHQILIRSRNQRVRVLLSLNKLFAFDIDSINDGSERIRDCVEIDYPFKRELDLLSETETVKFTLWGDSEVAYSDWETHKGRITVVGSSNGLVCCCGISSAEDIVFLYNPTIGEYSIIPDLPESMRFKVVNKDLVAFDIHGFGFDATNNDYKVVKFVVGGDPRNTKLKANVYSLKTDSWRRIRKLRYRHVHPSSGLYLNGAIHWIVKLKEEEDENKRVIAAFDLKTEKFRDIELPDDVGDCNHPFMKLEVGSLKGSLCVSYGCFDMHDDIWVMNEYGIQSSWSKIQITRLYNSMKPICSTKSGKEVLVMIDGCLVLYNFECDTSRTLKIRGVKVSHGFEGHTYVESLISPNSYGIGN